MILQSLLCVFGWHRTRLIEGCALALLGCINCGQVERWWLVCRPEIAIAEQRAHDKVMAAREARVAQMTYTVKPRLRRVG